MHRPFGYSLHLDIYDCDITKLDDLEFGYRFLQELVRRLCMTPFTPPMMFHGPVDEEGKEIYPGKMGITGFIALIESAVVFHTIMPDRFVTIDVYTCGNLEPDGDITTFILESFGGSRCEKHFLVRGTEYIGGQ